MFVIYNVNTKKIVTGSISRNVVEQNIGENEAIVELPDSEYDKTLDYDYGTAWFLADNNTVELRNYEEKHSDKDLAQLEINQLEDYLLETDYIITKLNELRIEEDESYELERANYSETLQRRKKARARINELQKILKS